MCCSRRGLPRLVSQREGVEGGTQPGNVLPYVSSRNIEGIRTQQLAADPRLLLDLTTISDFCLKSRQAMRCSLSVKCCCCSRVVSLIFVFELEDSMGPVYQTGTRAAQDVDAHTHTHKVDTLSRG